MICGFELDDTAEYTGATSLSVENTYMFLSPYYGKVLANGNVYWTLNLTNSSLVVIRVNVRVPLNSHIKPIKMTRGGYEWSVRIDDSGTESKTITLTHSAGTNTYAYGIPADRWVQIVFYVGHLNLGLYIENNMLCDNHNTSYSGATGTITELRAEAFTPSGSSTLYIDDVVLDYGNFAVERPMAVVLPYIPLLDTETGLFPSIEGAAHWTLIDEKAPNDDTDYVYMSGAYDMRDYFGSQISVIPGWEPVYVQSVKTLLRVKKTAAGTGAEAAYVYLRVGDYGPGNGTMSLPVTTSYANVISDFYTAFDGGFNPITKFTNANSNDAIQLGLRLIATAGVDVRATKFRACALVIYAPKAYTGGISSDIVGTGGWDLSFDVDTTSWSNLDYVTAYINAPGTPLGAQPLESKYVYTGVRIQYRTSNSAVLLSGIASSVAGEVLQYETVSLGARRKFSLHYVGHDNFISVFESGRWLYTFTYSTISYPSAINLYMLSNLSPTLTNVVASELSDWREATYIDMQSSISSGISSVIQERPVEILPLQGGIVDFSYNRTRTNITPANIYTHSYSSQNNSSAGSHYIVYYKDVAVVTDENFMDSNGYVTRVLQMSNLDSGATEAAKILAQRGREAQEMHSVELAPDIRIEPGDKATLSYTLSGTGTVVSKEVIVERTSMNITEGEVTMSLGGRKYV